MITVQLLLTLFLPWTGALLVLIVGDQRPRLQHILAVSFSLGAGAAALTLLPVASNQAYGIQVGGILGDFTFVLDGLGVYLAAIATCIGSLAVIFSTSYMKGEAQLGRYYATVLIFLGAMVGLVLTSNLLLTFIFWEITALCSYALISFHNDDPKAVSGGIKALIITQLGGIGLLAGALFLRSSLGTYDIPTFLNHAGELPSTVLSIMAFGFLAAAAAKSAQFPFQTWLPDAMEAPTPISALIHAATMVNAGVYLLARFYPVFSGVPGWSTTVICVGTVTALMAAIMAAVAVDLKRVLAYSTVSQLGFMVYAIGVGGIYASQFHLFSHAIFKALLFLAAGAVIHTVGTRDMREMGGLGKQMPLVQAVFIIGALALSGLPILNGFWSKELILEAGLPPGGPWWAYAVMLLTAGITAFYTLRCVWMVFFGKRNSGTTSHAHGPETETASTPIRRDATPAMKAALIPLAVGALLSWLLAGPFAQLLKSSYQLSIPQAHKLLTIHDEIFVEVLNEGTLTMIHNVLTSPATWLALVVITLGLAAWVWRVKLSWLTKKLRWLTYAAENSFGFEAINRSITRFTIGSSEILRGSQTGLLNWNIFGIIAALVLVLVVLVVGG